MNKATNSRRTLLSTLTALTLGTLGLSLAKAQDNVPAKDFFSGIDAAKTVEEIKKSFLMPLNWTDGEFEGRKLLFGILVHPTDGISVIDVHGWIYNEHFKEWRRFLKVNTRHIGGVKLLLKNGIVSVQGTANGQFQGADVLRFDLRATSNDAD